MAFRLFFVMLYELDFVQGYISLNIFFVIRHLLMSSQALSFSPISAKTTAMLFSNSILLFSISDCAFSFIIS